MSGSEGVIEGKALIGRLSADDSYLCWISVCDASAHSASCERAGVLQVAAAHGYAGTGYPAKGLLLALKASSGDVDVLHSGESLVLCLNCST